MDATSPPPLNDQHEPTWYRIALAEIGVQEVHGPGDNPRVQEYLATVHGHFTHDETPWCSAFANWCMLRAGLHGTGRANARSWLDWGIELAEPKVGCVVVFSRDSAGPRAGHVALYVATAGDDLRVLGGNQHNRVCVRPYARARAIGYRWPTLTPGRVPPPC